MKANKNKPAFPLIEITMFGDLQFRAGDVDVSARLNHSKKMTALLSYLIIHSDRNISCTELLDTLWPESDRDDPVNALKTLIYRIRMLLKESGFPYYRECILVHQGTYRWNPDFACSVDVIDFEKACKEALTLAATPEEKIPLLQKAISLYNGEFLPKCAMDEWVVPLSTYYYALYLRAVNALLHLLREQQEDSEIVDLCRRALLFEPVDENLHYNLMVALINLSMIEDARSQYAYVTRLFFNKLGVPPSERIRDLYQRMMESEKHTEADLDMIETELREPSGSSGAYICEYSIFKEVYRLQSRMAARAGITIFLGLLTITGSENRPLELKALNTAMSQLEVIMSESLRRTDVVSRFSSSQYVCMLPGVSAENCKAGVQRCINIFKKKHSRSPAVVHYTLQPLEAAEI